MLSEGYAHFVENKTLCCCVSLCCCVLMGVWLTFLIYLGMYSFSNPDKDAWLGHLTVADKTTVIAM